MRNSTRGPARRFVLALAATGLLALPLGLAPLTAQESAPKPRPYKPVAIELPTPVKDASFEAFRKQIADIAGRKDRAALAKHAARDFFWMTDDGSDATDKKRSGGDNLIRALYLDSPDTEGWDLLALLAAESSADPWPQRKGVICGPGEPKYDSAAAADLATQTETSSSFWYYPVAAGVEVRAGPGADSAVAGKLGLHLVWVHPDDSAPGERLRIVLPSGQLGYVAAESLLPLPIDLLCYVKDGNTWRIAGYVGGLPPQK
jgi:hypothetical protein